MTREEITNLKNIEQAKIFEAQSYLVKTDYIALKLAEEVTDKQHYADQLARREASRAIINAAQSRIEELDALIPEEEIEPIEA